MLLLRIVIPAAILVYQPHCHALTRDVFRACEEWDKKTARERIGENRKGKIFFPSSSPPGFLPSAHSARDRYTHGGNAFNTEQLMNKALSMTKVKIYRIY